jgi:hypothetical protein
VAIKPSKIQKIPNDHEVYQNFPSKGLPKFTQFLFENLTSGNHEGARERDGKNSTVSNFGAKLFFKFWRQFFSFFSNFGAIFFIFFKFWRQFFFQIFSPIFFQILAPNFFCARVSDR